MSATLDLDALQRAVDGLREEKANVDRERQQLESQKQVVMENLERFKGRIKLNVGGTKLETTLSTLTRYPDSMLGTMFSGREGIEVPVDDDGYVFIDRDGTHFRAILNFLRSGKITFPKDKQECELLKEEMRYYMLEPYIPQASGRSGQPTAEPSVQILFTNGVDGDYCRDIGQSTANAHARAISQALAANEQLRYHHSLCEEFGMVSVLAE